MSNLGSTFPLSPYRIVSEQNPISLNEQTANVSESRKDEIKRMLKKYSIQVSANEGTSTSTRHIVYLVSYVNKANEINKSVKTQSLDEISFFND